LTVMLLGAFCSWVNSAVWLVVWDAFCKWVQLLYYKSSFPKHIRNSGSLGLIKWIYLPD
jgi:hypothetical protein